MSDIEDIKKALKSEKIMIGTKEVIKNLRLGKVKKVFLTSNRSEEHTSELQSH